MEVNDRIAQKALEMFMQFGIRSVSMDDIAGSLGISKKTIYQYFADKDELVGEVIQSKTQGMQGECIYCNQQAKDAIHEIFITRRVLIEQFQDMNPVVLFDLEKFHPDAFSIFSEHKNQFLLEVIRKNLDWGISDGLYRDNLDPDILSKFRLDSMMSPFNMKLFPPAAYNLADVSREIILHYVYGIASPKGMELIEKYNQEQPQKHQSL